MKERDRRGKRFRLRNLSKWLELLLGIKTKLYFNGLEFAIRTSKSNTIKRRNSIDRSIALKEGETLKREYRYVKKEDAIIDRRKLIETRGRKGEWKGRWGRVKGRSFGCTMGGPVRALSREIPPSLPPSVSPHSTRANSRDGQIKTDNSRARPRFGPTSASGSPVSTNRRPDPTTPYMPLPSPFA